MYLAFSWEDGAFTVKRYHQGELEKLRAEQEEAMADVYAREVADVVRSAGSWALNKSDLIDRLTEADMSRRGAEEAIERAEELGLIESEKQGRARLFALAGEGNGGQK
jgi:DNA-binding transcriptional ArsR family regulator